MIKFNYLPTIYESFLNMKTSEKEKRHFLLRSEKPMFVQPVQIPAFFQRKHYVLYKYSERYLKYNEFVHIIIIS